VFESGVCNCIYVYINHIEGVNSKGLESWFDYLCQVLYIV
jgi:hypothetical protein